MGLCRDFVSQIAEGCDHPMQADSDSCHCERCGVVCRGRFTACPSVWARGPQPVTITKGASASDDLGDGLTWESVANGQSIGRELVVPDVEVVVGDADVVRSTAGVPTDANGQVSNVARTPTTIEPGTNGQTAAAHGRAVEGVIAASAGTNGRAGPNVSASHSPPTAGDNGGPEMLRLLQNAFEALRSEVEGLRRALSHEQALPVRLLEARTNPELDAARLQDVIEATVRKAMQDEVAGMHEKVAATVEDLRTEIEALRASRKDDVAGFQSLVAAAEAKSVSPADLNRSEAGTRKAFRATLHEELHPVVEVVAESVAQSEFQLQTIDRKIETLNESGATLAEALAEVRASVAALSGSDPAGSDPRSSVNPLGPPGKRVSLRKPPAEHQIRTPSVPWSAHST